MLVAILKLETSPDIKRETVRLLGILGALDPTNIGSRTKLKEYTS